MNISRAVLAGLLVFFVAAGTRAVAQQESTAPAEKVETAWLAIVDKADYESSWKTAAGTFRAAVTEPQWEQAMKSVRAPLGKVISRKPRSAVFTKTVPGAPDGSYVIATYKTSFENKAEAVETVTATLDRDSNWHVTGYFIQ